MVEETREELLGYYRTMLTIRKFEKRVERLFLEGIVSGTCHLCEGQEATPVGARAALRQGDYAVSTHRGHGHFIAWGGEPKRLMAEIFGKIDGYSGGRGGSQHIAAFETGFLGSNGITGGGIPIATGAALAVKMKKKDNVVVSFLGDGATNQGAFHEAVNLASVWKLPIIYLCENNLYAMSTPVRDAFNIKDIAVRGKAYGIPGIVIDGNDVLAVKAVVQESAERARSGGGPTLIESKTYRFSGHSRSDRFVYRTREEEAEWRKRDPIIRFRAKLMDLQIISDEDDQKIQAEVDQRIREAEEFARSSVVAPIESAVEGVYA